MDVTTLTGSVPSGSAFTIFQNGDTIVATSTGGAGGTWIALAKLYNSLPAGEYVTAIVGDPGTIPTPLISDYALDMATIPDCTTCFGTTCTALTSQVNVLSSGSRVMEKILEPRQVLSYNGRNDGSSVDITFIKGEASSATCAGMAGMTGPQPVSVYVVNIVPPIGFSQQFLQTPTTAPTPVPPTQVPTAKAGSLPLAVLAAAGIGAALFAYRKP
jgi:hypothetical protein